MLENQKEVKYLTYWVHFKDDGKVEANFSTGDITKNYLFKDEKTCLNKLIDVLFELKKLEKWYLKRIEE